MLQAIFAAIRRLAASLERTADIVDATNQQLELRLSIVDGEEPQRRIEANGRRAEKVRA